MSLGKELAVSFDGEEGIDAGGLLKSWLSGVTEQLVTPGELLLPVIYRGATTCLRLNPIPNEIGLDDASVVQRLRLLGILIGTSLVSNCTVCLFFLLPDSSCNTACLGQAPAFGCSHQRLYVSTRFNLLAAAFK